MDGLKLPAAPADLTGPVTAWPEPVEMPTYLPGEPDKNPMFLEKRVYQGSSGKVYPLPFIDRICEEKVPRSWEAVHLENEFVRVMILPELGGRIGVALDKTNGYDFVYRQNVIKPALVGLAGPWISGGIEFNWPQHHRPSTFMPADFHIEEHADGSRTVWLSEHEPMNRMKGMHGVCLHPGKAYIEVKARLYNRTPLVQTFLWWANVAARVHEKYQSFFPPDVRYVADHARRAMSTFPVCDGVYYGVDYGSRRGNDLSWQANIPVPTSYMCVGTAEDFFGGYDHAAEAGFVHVADHHIAPGKKQWTWGNHQFGLAWERNLTDADGPYIELMAGVYTDNQPDFSFLHPYETRTFSQYWYPIQKIGAPQKANLDAAVSLQIRDGRARVGVSASSVFPRARVTLETGGKAAGEWRAEVGPGNSLLAELDLETAEDPAVVVRGADGVVLIEYRPVQKAPGQAPAAAKEPPAPEQMGSVEELYLTGLHLEQYRHATRSAALYWEEGLRREPGDVRCNNALGLWRLRRGEFERAAEHFGKAAAKLTALNPNPYDGEAHYNLGLALRWLGRGGEAYGAFYKATWNYAWQSAAFYALAELDCSRGDWAAALGHLERSLKVNADHLKARNLKAVVLRKMGRSADAWVAQTLAIDPLDFWAKYLAGHQLNCDVQVRLDIALDFAGAGLAAEARASLADVEAGGDALVQYYIGYFGGGCESYRRGSAAAGDYCFPSRLEEMVILQAALAANPGDARAAYYLGNFLYDRRRHAEAMEMWERSSALEGSFSVVWRNLGIGYHNVNHDGGKARAAYERAVAANGEDARLWYERDQLWKRLGEKPARRLEELEKRLDLVARRDDLTVELAALYNQMGVHERALAVMSGRRFQPWEGGEGLALGQYARSHLGVGRRALAGLDFAGARRHFEMALDSPANLSEARHLLANQSDVLFWLGEACLAGGDEAAAIRHWTAAAGSGTDFVEMSVRQFSEMTYYRAMALGRLGRTEEARALLGELLAYAQGLAGAEAKIDYFATSLPTMLIFEDDLQKRQSVTAMFLKAQAHLGLGDEARAMELLEGVLKLDGNHAMAGDLMNGRQCDK